MRNEIWKRGVCHDLRKNNIPFDPDPPEVNLGETSYKPDIALGDKICLHFVYRPTEEELRDLGMMIWKSDWDVVTLGYQVDDINPVMHIDKEDIPSFVETVVSN